MSLQLPGTPRQCRQLGLSERFKNLVQKGTSTLLPFSGNSNTLMCIAVAFFVKANDILLAESYLTKEDENAIFRPDTSTRTAALSRNPVRQCGAAWTAKQPSRTHAAASKQPSHRSQFRSCYSTGTKHASASLSKSFASNFLFQSSLLTCWQCLVAQCSYLEDLKRR